MTPSTRRLDPARPYKPLDVGNGLIAGSVTPEGRILELGTFSRRHGYAVASGLGAFADAQRHDPQAVRRHRAGLAARSADGFGLRAENGWDTMDVALIAGMVPRATLRTRHLHADVTTWAPVIDDAVAVVQAWELACDADAPAIQQLLWDGPVGLSRAALTQLTEGGVVPHPATPNSMDAAGERLSVHAAELGVALVIGGLPPAEPANWHGQPPVNSPGRTVVVAPGTSHRLVFVHALGDDPAAAAATAGWLRDRIDPAVEPAHIAQQWHRRLHPTIDRAPAKLAPHVQRGVGYLLACCALPVDEGTCLLTDHRILPLSWTRDSYWFADALLATGTSQAIETVRRHLVWLFEIAERREGCWPRSHLPNGAAKDPAFQLDQQWYPLLELAAYIHATGDQATWRRLSGHVDAVLAAIDAHRHPHLALFATTETPADDPLALPYHTSSHILAWHTLHRLAAIATIDADPAVTAADATALAEEIRQAVFAHLITSHGDRQMLAYAGDANGNVESYHDANDLPTALAPVWGFCDVDDPVWRATMAHAFSDDNPGYFPGEFGGLGSRHTPGAWPLGDVQELVYRRLVGDHDAAANVADRLAATATWDAALPEARDPNTGTTISRHWFGWPGAALTSALLQWHPA